MSIIVFEYSSSYSTRADSTQGQPTVPLSGKELLQSYLDRDAVVQTRAFMRPQNLGSRVSADADKT